MLPIYCCDGGFLFTVYIGFVCFFLTIYTIWQKVSGHLTITLICGPSPVATKQTIVYNVFVCYSINISLHWAQRAQTCFNMTVHNVRSIKT